MTYQSSRPVEAEELYIYSREDIEKILGDAFVDLREVTGDDVEAAECVDVLYDRLTDDFYGHTR